MSLNKVVLEGRLTRDVELNAGETPVVRNCIACTRRFAKQGEERQSDFIPIVAFGKSAEFIEKYFKKGDPIAIVGRMTSGSYDNKDGVKVYTLDCTVEEINFVDGKKSGSDNTANSGPSNNQGTETTTEAPAGLFSNEGGLPGLFN